MNSHEIRQTFRRFFAEQGVVRVERSQPLDNGVLDRPIRLAHPVAHAFRLDAQLSMAREILQRLPPCLCGNARSLAKALFQFCFNYHKTVTVR